MEPIIIGIGFLVILIIACLHREKNIENQFEQKLKIYQLQNDQLKLENMEKNQSKQNIKIKKLEQEIRKLEKRVEKEFNNVKEEVNVQKNENQLNQEATKAKFDSVGENINRLFSKHSKINSKFNQQQIVLQGAEKQNAERYFSHDAKLQVTQATSKLAIKFQGKNIDMLQGGLQSNNQKMDQHKVDLFNSQMQNRQRFHQQETKLVQQAESQTAIKYIDQSIQQLNGDLKSTNQNVAQQQIEYHHAQLQNEHHFHQQQAQLQAQQAESKTAIKYIDQNINKLQIDTQSTNQRVDQQQNEFNNARVQIANQFCQQRIEIEITKQASRSAIEILDSKLAILQQANQEQKSATNQLIDAVEAIHPLVKVGVKAIKVISELSNDNDNSSCVDQSISYDYSSE